MPTTKSPWNRILCARTTSQAIELAADIPLPQLNDTPLPLDFEQLSFHAQENARAVGRALGVRVPGLKETGWELWEETEEDREFFRDVDVNDGKDDHLDKLHGGESNSEEMEDLFDDEDSDVLMGDDKHRSKTTDATGLPGKGGRSGVDNQEAVKTPTTEESNAAETLKSWAISSSHTTPPADAVEIISRSGSVPALLSIIVPKDGLPDVLAPVISAFTENAGSAFASILMNSMVIPYTNNLKAPAPRDIMQALVSFSDRHWRVGVGFYEFFSEQETAVSGAVAEIMVRTAAVITLDGAMQGLRTWCKATWGEDGIRVIEALLARCKTEAGVAGLVVPALERNVIGSEKSVRFGKLLFTVVRDLPGIAEDFGAPLESICSRSTVFLAKRALTLLRGKLPNA